MSINISLYDFFCMVFIGFLLIILVAPYVPTDINLFYYAGCYTIGMIFHKIVELTTPCLRNCPYILHRGYQKAFFNKQRKKYCENNQINRKITADYLYCYYYLQDKKMLGSIPTLEAQSAFLKNLWFLCILYILFTFKDLERCHGLFIFLLYFVYILSVISVMKKQLPSKQKEKLCCIFATLAIILVVLTHVFFIKTIPINSSYLISGTLRSFLEQANMQDFSAIVTLLEALSCLLVLIIPWLWYSSETKISYLVWETSNFCKEQEKNQ